jgi:hypothetical protein
VKRGVALTHCHTLPHTVAQHTQVNKVINMLACWFEDPDSLAFKK